MHRCSASILRARTDASLGSWVSKRWDVESGTWQPGPLEPSLLYGPVDWAFPCPVRSNTSNNSDGNNKPLEGTCALHAARCCRQRMGIDFHRIRLSCVCPRARVLFLSSTLPSSNVVAAPTVRPVSTSHTDTGLTTDTTVSSTTTAAATYHVANRLHCEQLAGLPPSWPPCHPAGVPIQFALLGKSHPTQRITHDSLSPRGCSRSHQGATTNTVRTRPRHCRMRLAGAKQPSRLRSDTRLAPAHAAPSSSSKLSRRTMAL